MWTGGTCKKLGSSLTLSQFQMCCANDQAMLTPLSHIPAEVKDLLIRNDVIAKESKESTTTCNPALSFTLSNVCIATNCLDHPNATYKTVNGTLSVNRTIVSPNTFKVNSLIDK